MHNCNIKLGYVLCLDMFVILWEQKLSFFFLLDKETVLWKKDAHKAMCQNSTEENKRRY